MNGLINCSFWDLCRVLIIIGVLDQIRSLFFMVARGSSGKVGKKKIRRRVSNEQEMKQHKQTNDRLCHLFETEEKKKKN
jgi:hypothetical protein